MEAAPGAAELRGGTIRKEVDVALVVAAAAAAALPSTPVGSEAPRPGLSW